MCCWGHDEKWGAEEKAEVCSVTQSEGVSEEVGAMGGERLGLLGRARAALRHGSHICGTSDSEKPILFLLRPDLYAEVTTRQTKPTPFRMAAVIPSEHVLPR